MPTYIQGLAGPISFAAQTETRIDVATREIYTNECPLFTRLDREPATAEKWTKQTKEIRAKTYTIQTAIADGSTTTVVLTGDARGLMIGDVLEITNTAGTVAERIEITAEPVFSTNTTLTVRRGRSGTVGAANNLSVNASAILMGNSRTGKEIDQTGTMTANVGYDQIVQTFQYPVQVGGRVNAIQAIRIPDGAADLFGAERAGKLTEMMTEAEVALLYGKYEAPAAEGDRAKMRGLRDIIAGYNSGSNVKLTGGASYTKLLLVADMFQKARTGGGNPDTFLCSYDFLTGFATWSYGIQQFTGVSTPLLGVGVKGFMFPFSDTPVMGIVDPALQAGTAALLEWKDIKIRTLRPESWKPRGSRGDAEEGEWLMDFAIDVDHPGHHAWVQGITSFA